MFLDPKPKSKLDLAIDEVLVEMSHHSASTDEYGKLLERLTALEKLRKEPRRPSPDVLIQSAVHILGIAMIIRYEELNIITSKALSFIPRVK
jgi:hypothetical protein